MCDTDTPVIYSHQTQWAGTFIVHFKILFAWGTALPTYCNSQYVLLAPPQSSLCLQQGFIHPPTASCQLEASTCCRSTEVSVGVMPTVRAASMLFLVSARGWSMVKLGIEAYMWLAWRLIVGAAALSMGLRLLSLCSFRKSPLAVLFLRQERKTRSKDSLLWQATMRYTTLNPFKRQEAMHSAGPVGRGREPPPLWGIPALSSQWPASASSGNQQFSSA